MGVVTGMGVASGRGRGQQCHTTSDLTLSYHGNGEAAWEQTPPPWGGALKGAMPEWEGGDHPGVEKILGYLGGVWGWGSSGHTSIGDSPHG